MSLDRPDLSAAFTNKKAPIDRTAGLTGLLPAPRPRPSTSTPPPSTTLNEAPNPTPEAVAEPAPVAAPTPSSPVRPIRAAKNPPVSDSATITANVAVYLEPDLLDLVKTQRRATDATYDEVVLAAFADIDENQIRAAFTPDHAPGTGAGMPARQRRLRGTAGIQLQLRLDTVQRAWLDQTRDRVGAPSRSALVAQVLRLHLTA